MFGWSIDAASSDSAQEAVTERLVAREAGGEQLESNLALEPQILGQVDDAHAASSQQRLDPVAGDLGADLRVVAHLHVPSSLSAA